MRPGLLVEMEAGVLEGDVDVPVGAVVHVVVRVEGERAEATRGPDPTGRGSAAPDRRLRSRRRRGEPSSQVMRFGWRRRRVQPTGSGSRHWSPSPRRPRWSRRRRSLDHDATGRQLGDLPLRG